MCILLLPLDSEEIATWRKAANWLCGIEKQEENPLSAEEMRAIEEKQNSLYEKPIWKRVANINAVLVMTAAVFFWGFFY